MIYAEGCKRCVKGEKLVLFITGLCTERCFFCPVSEKKFGRDCLFANEWEAKNFKDVVKEAELTDAKGAGITGGDPLVKLDKTCSYIKGLKEKFGSDFHIHLYTPLKLVEKEKLEKLHDAGLDEIRFHLKPGDDIERIDLAKGFSWDVGVEIPSLPDKIDWMKSLADELKGKISFMNLNELEFSDTSVAHYDMSGYSTKDRDSYAAEGSFSAGEEIEKYASFPVHVCSASLKDSLQMANRIKRRANKVARPFEIVTDEGMLIRGCLYDDKDETLEFVRSLGIESEREKDKIIMAPEDAEDFKEELKKKGQLAIVEQYPTRDEFEIEKEFL
ncbi:MAG: radical SAM protein [Nanobdellota archaeon]